MESLVKGQVEMGAGYLLPVRLMFLTSLSCGDTLRSINNQNNIFLLSEVITMTVIWVALQSLG